MKGEATGDWGYLDGGAARLHATHGTENQSRGASGRLERLGPCSSVHLALALSEDCDSRSPLQAWKFKRLSRCHDAESKPRTLPLAYNLLLPSILALPSPVTNSFPVRLSYCLCLRCRSC